MGGNQRAKVEVVSSNEALGLIEEYYDIAESLYFLSSSEFKINRSSSPFLISNYEEVIHKYISSSYLEEFQPALVYEENGKYYMEISGFAEGYNDLQFSDIEIDADRISCVVTFDLYVGDELIEDDIESDFAIVKEDGEWKIDSYTSDYMLHYDLNPDDFSNTYTKNEKVELSSKLGKEISKLMDKVWLPKEMYADSMAEFQNVKNAPKAYLAVCAAFEAWGKLTGDNFEIKATIEDFNEALVDLFGEKADGLLTEVDIENVFFVTRNQDGTYSFMGFDGSESEGNHYYLKGIERADDQFFVEQYEYKYLIDGQLWNLSDGEGLYEHIYDLKNNLIDTFIVRAIQEDNITRYQTYTKDGVEIDSLEDYMIQYHANELSLRKIELAYNEEKGTFTVVNNRLEK